MLIPLYTLSISLMLFFPLVLAIGLRRRVAVPWWLFCVGMVTFIGSQVVHLPLNNWLTNLGWIDAGANEGAAWWRTAVLLGLTAGLCEELARAVGYGWLRRKGDVTNHLPAALLLGIGHGGIEAMVFGGVLTAASVTSLLALQGTDLNTLGLPATQLEQLQQQMTWFTAYPLAALLPLLERLIAMTLHITLSVWVWRGFQRRNPLYLLLAILIHAAIDAIAVLLHQSVTNPWLLELLFALAVLPGAVWLWRLWQGEKVSFREQISGGKAGWREMAVFVTAVRKELWQQWRTKRVLVITAVFLLFGLTSPMLAYFTPKLIQNLPGAEQFANLIPTPTAADAVGQYIKNLTQFGFILAVLLGMGLVAGEKEHGTAAMMLSKPLPRWAFILSKFVAQTAVYALAFLAAALAAYFYTWILFEPLNLAAFLFGNFLLLVWILVFSAVTLLASTLANSTGAAAGLALAGAIVLAILGSLPNIGALFPAGLVAWASTLGLPTATVAVNGGALTASTGLIIICLVTAVAVFEVQEL